MYHVAPMTPNRFRGNYGRVNQVGSLGQQQTFQPAPNNLTPPTQNGNGQFDIAPPNGPSNGNGDQLPWDNDNGNGNGGGFDFSMLTDNPLILIAIGFGIGKIL